MVKTRSAYGVERCVQGFGMKPEGKRPLRRHICRWENNIKMNLQEVGCCILYWIELAQDRDRRRLLVNAVMNFGFCKMKGNSWLAENRLAFQEGLSSMD